MEWFTKAFLKASLVWLGLGVSLGLAMACHPVWTVYRAVHLHMNLLGFVAVMIFGVAYHVIPRFTGIGGSLSSVGAFVFIFNIWRTIDGPRPAASPPLRQFDRAPSRTLRVY